MQNPQLKVLPDRGSEQSPGTPQPSQSRGSGSALNELIRTLENKWRLGLSPRVEMRSPSKAANSMADKVYNNIQRLYYTDRPALDRILVNFDTEAAHGAPLTKLQSLLQLLQRVPTQVKTPQSDREKVLTLVPPCK
jgi:hypothetical protein